MSKNNKYYKEILTSIFFFILGALFILIIHNLIPLNGQSQSPQIYEKASLSKSVEKIYDAVVVVESFADSNLEGTGTGFIYKKDKKNAYILTNEHVLSSSNETKVILSNDEEIDAEVLGKEENTCKYFLIIFIIFTDLAVLRKDKKYASLVATTGSSENLKLGDTVFTVGSPLGVNYRGSVTSGVLSGKDRMVSISVASEENDWVMQVLQIDASINPGNSGGPLLNVNGEVIGICSMKLVDDNIEGMGFAIPIEFALSHVNTLENGEKIKWPVLGIGMINAVDRAKLARYNLSIPDDVKEGVVIQSIKDGSASKNANLKKGDIIIKINKVSIKDIAHLKYELYKYQSKDKIEITYIRNQKEKSIKVTLD